MFKPNWAMITTGITLILVSLMSSCSTQTNKDSENTNDKQKPKQALSLDLKDHNLVNKIWDVKNQNFLTQQDVLRKILESDYILLGETHDNIEHHNGQSWVIQELQKHNKQVGVAFEMISMTQAESTNLNSFTSTEQLIEYLEQEESGWQFGIYYKQLFDNVRQAKYQIYPANINRSSLMQALRKNGEKIPENIRKIMDNNPLPEKPKETLKEEIIKSHCGVANEGMVKAMTMGQRVRDAVMADMLLTQKAESKLPMVLIAGSGHIRNDRAVPMFLKNEDQDSKVISLAWLEVDEEAKTVADYINYWKDGHLPFDYVWFTAQVQRPDPCEEMRRMHKKHSQQAQSETTE